MRAARKGTAATVYRVVVPARSDVCLPFAHASAGDAAQVSFTITSSPEAIHRTARYVTTFDDPYGSGNLADPEQGDLPPVIFNADDRELFVDVRVSVGAPSFRCRWNTKSLKRHTARQSCIFSWMVSRWSRCLSGCNSSGSEPPTARQNDPTQLAVGHTAQLARRTYAYSSRSATTGSTRVARRAGM